MNNTIRRRTLLAASLAAALCGPVAAEDIDLFVGSNSKAKNPNIVIMIDNSANWDAANQHWPNNMKQGQSEIRALAKVASEIKDGSVDLGLMLFTPGVGSTPDGGYVRFAVRTMDAANKTAFQQLLGVDGATMTANCVTGNNSVSLNPNCIFQNFSSPSEKVGSAKTNYSGGLFDVFKYFGGFTDPAHAINAGIAGSYTGGTPVNATHFGVERYARNSVPTVCSNANEPNADPAAYTGCSGTSYVPPQGTADSCAKNYLIFVGNGFPTQDAPASLLSGVNGTTAQLKMPNFTSSTSTVTSVLGTDAACKSSAQCATDAASNPSFSGYDSYVCSGGVTTAPVTLGTDTTCETAAQCQTRAATLFPGYTTYTCSGGTGSTSTSNSANRCETRTDCATNAPTYFPGFSSYTCTAGLQTGGIVNLGTDATNESSFSCAASAAIKFPGWTSYSCAGGTATGSTAAYALGTDTTCRASTAACATAAQSAFPGHATYSCSGGTGAGCGGGQKKGMTINVTDTVFSGQSIKGSGCSGSSYYSQVVTATNGCTSNQIMTGSNSCSTGQTVTGSKTVVSVVPTGTFSTPTTSTINNADEWARFLYLTDANGAPGQQNITTYTIDVYKDAQDANESALLFSMAKYGGGRYFRATDENSIIAALREILTEIQSVNTVFAAASLPINATNRSQNENQVFIGMFRPDGKGKPRWYGNLKRYQAALFSGDARLAGADGKEAISATTGFITACAVSFYSTDSDLPDPTSTTTPKKVTHYWEFSPQSAGSCTDTTVGGGVYNDLPDGNIVEKGGAGEVLRMANSGTGAVDFSLVRKMLTCTGAPCASLVDFNDTNVTMARTGAADALSNTAIVSYTQGLDVLDENNNAVTKETRPSMHGDIAHSRPLPVNFGGSRKVEVYYGSNDGALHAMEGETGKELWSFIAPEHHAKLKRLYDNDPVIAYPNLPAGTVAAPKDYFFDGSAGLYQNADNSQVWIYPTMRRGGRMIYAFDVSNAGTPALLWSFGCPSQLNDTGCSTGATGIGNTWSVPSAAFILGYNGGKDPVVIVGGGMDQCEDADSAVTTCSSSSKGHKVFVLDAKSGKVLQSFDTDGSVPADVTLIDRDFDSKVDHAYAVDTRGALYRMDFVDQDTLAPLAAGAWKITKIAQSSGASRKFLFAPSGLYTTDGASPTPNPVTYLAFGSGDRERPLITNYPYTQPVQNRFYMYIDRFETKGLPFDLDGASMADFSSPTSCADVLDSTQKGWFMDLAAGQGEQTVTGSVIFGGTIFFSTNRPIKPDPNSCDTNLGEARGYAVNLLNASGVIGSGGLCGGTRSGIFTGGGLPPSPVVGTVPVKDGKTDRPISVLIGGINLDGNNSSPIGLQQPPIPIKSIRSRLYWYNKGTDQ